MSTESAVDVRRLPVAIPALAGETLPSYLDRLSADLGIPLGLLLASVGLIDEDSRMNSATGYGFALPESRLVKLAYATGQRQDRLSEMLLTTLHGTVVNLTGLDVEVPDTFRAVAAREWLYATGSHFCPVCLTVDQGVWQMVWRLPWSFACTRHHVLLVDTCPSCGQRPQDARRDGRSTPAFISHVPVLGHCSNAAPAGEGLRGRAGSPCGADLRQAETTLLRKGPVLPIQVRLDELLAGGPIVIGEEIQPLIAYLQDLRGLISVLLSYGEAADIQLLLGATPTRKNPEWALPQLASAWQEYLDSRQERAAQRISLGRSGIDPRRGPRHRAFQDAPEAAALMALLCTAVVPALDSGDAQFLAPFAEAARRGNHPGLIALLAGRHASPRLLTLAYQAQQQTGRFVQAGALALQSPRPANTFNVAHIPALLWVDEWPSFASLFAGTGTMPETARRFIATALVKSLAAVTWVQAGVVLGWPAASTRTLAANLVNRLNKAGAAQAFHVELALLTERLRNGEMPLPNLSARRRLLRDFTAVPQKVLARTGLVVTDARSRNGAAWLWAELTSGSVWSAPAWGDRSATPNEKEVYRRFVRKDLPHAEQAIRDYGLDLIRKN